MGETRPEERVYKIEAVLRILDPDEVSDERIEAFTEAARQNREWLDAVKHM